MTQQIEPVELQEFVKQTMEAIENGADIESRTICGQVDFEVVINNVKKVDGGIKVYVVSGAGLSSTEKITRIKFSVNPKDSESSKREYDEVLRQNKDAEDNWGAF